MGCSVSREIYPLAKYESSFTGSGLTSRHKAVGIQIPLTEREIFSITKSWKAISINMINTGISMFRK